MTFPRKACLILVLAGHIWPGQGAVVFQQNFAGSTAQTDYENATSPTTGQFNDIGEEADGGSWSINTAGQLELARIGATGTNNGAGLTRTTDFAGPPAVLSVKFDFGAEVNTWQNDVATLDIGNFSSVQDYNYFSPTQNVFARLAIDGAGSNGIRFELGGMLSAAIPGDGTMVTVSWFLNKSGSLQTYRAPDGSAHVLHTGASSLWVGNTCVADDLAAPAGSLSALTDLRLRFPFADAGKWKIDNIVIDNALPPTSPSKLALTPAMVINEVAVGDAGMLVDEQALSGDPVFGPPGGSPVTKFGPPVNGQTSWHYPLNAVIDLGAEYQITHVCFYDSNGTGNLTVSYGMPFNWTPLFTDGQAPYNTWRVFPVSITTRYLQFSMASNIVPNEIVLYGIPVGTAQAPPAPVPHVPPTFEKFMGVNGFPGDPLFRTEAVGNVREYHDWSYAEGHTSTTYPGYPANQNGFQPAWTGANYDTYYRNLAQVGIEAVPCVLRNVLWLTGNNGSLSENKPVLVNSGRSPTSPSSYVEHADHMFQFAARYGLASVADGLLKLRPGNPRLSGLGLINYYENWNEQDKWWRGRDAYFKPYEYAAMSSADADGHVAAMDGMVGLRKASPAAKLVMSGIAKSNLDYIKALKFWCDFNRDGDFPWDVINVHHYCNSGGGQFSGTTGVSPEADNLKQRMETIRQYRDQYLPGVEFWVSEFGYDTNSASTQGAPAIGSFSSEEVQAQWLVRSYLALAAAGVDRAFAYLMADQGPSTNPGIYVTCGLLTQSSAGYTPKISWWYVYTLRNRLKGLRFGGEQSSGNANVRIYRFVDASGVVKAYAVWCPTSNQTSVSGYQLTLQGSPASASVVNMQAGDPDGVRSPLAISSGKVAVNVSERPVFVIVDNTDPDFVLSSKLALTPSMVTSETGGGDPTRMVDEQTLSGDPREPQGGGAPTTVWTPTFGALNASAYIDLGQVRTIDRIYVRDMNGVGDLTIQAGSPGNWATIATDSLAPYLTWNQHIVNTSTRYLRFVRANGSSNFSEVVVYGK